MQEDDTLWSCRRQYRESQSAAITMNLCNMMRLRDSGVIDTLVAGRQPHRASTFRIPSPLLRRGTSVLSPQCIWCVRHPAAAARRFVVIAFMCICILLSRMFLQPQRPSSADVVARPPSSSLCSYLGSCSGKQLLRAIRRVETLAAIFVCVTRQIRAAYWRQHSRQNCRQGHQSTTPLPPPPSR